MARDEAGFFDRLYRNSADPWHFADSPYERARYRRIEHLVADDQLRRGRCLDVLEPGCSIGVLTRRIAPYCVRLLAFDFSSIAVERTRAACADFPQVAVVVHDVRRAPPRGVRDLLVFSEIGYYLEREALAAVMTSLRYRLKPSGTVIACHWRGCSDDHVLDGDSVHEVLHDALPSVPDRTLITPSYRLERWRHVGLA